MVWARILSDGNRGKTGPEFARVIKRGAESKLIHLLATAPDKTVVGKSVS